MPGNRAWRILRTADVVRTLLWSLLVLVAAVARAGTPSLVLDINTQRLPQSSSPIFLGTLGGYDYFIATPVPGSSQSALYKSDGTDAGTTQVQTIAGFGVFTYQQPALFIAAGTKAYFLAYQSTTGQEVWVTDGTTAGTHMVADLYPGQNGDPILLGLVGTDLIFAESTSATHWQIYRTDGTAAGTHPLSSFPDSTYGRLTESLVINGKVYMAIESATVCCQPDLWVTDGTSAGTVQIDSDEGYPWHLQPSSLRAFGNSVALLTNTENRGTEPSFVDTTTNALTILDTAPGPGPGVLYASTIAAMDGYILYLNGDPNSGLHLWRSDGTLAGTMLVQDLGPGEQFASISDTLAVTRVGNRAVFLSENAQNGPQLWSSDGTAQGTVPLIADPPPSTGGGVQTPLVGVVGTHGYFAVYSGSDYRIVVTDGTVAGTHVLTDVGPIDPSNTQVAGDDTSTFINAYKFDSTTGISSNHLFGYAPQTNTLTYLRDNSSVSPGNPILYDAGHLLFQSYDPVTGDEPWISDGTPSGTHQLQNVAPEVSTNDSNPKSFVNFGGQLVFTADDGVTGAELWASDGTAAGTKELADIDPGSESSSPSHLTVMNGALYFFAFDQTASHLMTIAIPGTAPEVLADLTPTPPVSQYYTAPCAQDRTAVMNGSVYFAAQQNGSSGYELWKTDGTAGGTVALTSLSAANPSSVPCYLTTVGNRVYFTTTTVASGNELWVTDGTSSGTMQVADLVPGVGSSSPALTPVPSVLNGLYYFAAANNLWRTDGTSAGTVMALSYATLTADANAYGSPVGLLNGQLLLEVFVPSSSTSPQLWLSDGTAAGSTLLHTPAVNFSTGVTIIGSKAYFAALDSAIGSEPWVTDGTPAGTFMLKDTDPQQNSSPSWYTNFNGVTVFEIDGASQRYELWQTDGTSAGTKFIATIGAPPASTVASIRPQLVIGQNLFFSAAGATTGVELFTLPNDVPVASPDSATSSNDAAVTINVVANDTDSDGAINPGSVRVTTNPTQGTAVVQSDGSIIYTPTAGYSGTDTFAYTVADNQGAVSAPAQVTVTVTATVTVTSTGSGTGSSGGGKGGGGAVGLLELAILLFFLNARLNRSCTAAAGTIRARCNWLH